MLRLVARFTSMAAAPSRSIPRAVGCAARLFEGCRRRDLSVMSAFHNLTRRLSTLPSSTTTQQSSNADLCDKTKRHYRMLNPLIEDMHRRLDETGAMIADIRRLYDERRIFFERNRLWVKASDLASLYVHYFCHFPDGIVDNDNISEDDAWEFMRNEAIEITKDKNIDSDTEAAKLNEIAAKYSMPPHIPLPALLDLKDDTCFEAPPGLSEEEAQRKFLEECETTDWSLLGSAKAANTVKEILKAMKGVELDYWL